MSEEKPHKGRITDWIIAGGRCFGRSESHPQFAGMDIRTSTVLKHDEETGEIETRNSRYTLVGPSVSEKEV